MRTRSALSQLTAGMDWQAVSNNMGASLSAGFTLRPN
jgi:hypothetical protein